MKNYTLGIFWRENVFTLSKNKWARKNLKKRRKARETVEKKMVANPKMRLWRGDRRYPPPESMLLRNTSAEQKEGVKKRKKPPESRSTGKSFRSHSPLAVLIHGWKKAREEATVPSIATTSVPENSEFGSEFIFSFFPLLGEFFPSFSTLLFCCFLSFIFSF